MNAGRIVTIQPLEESVHRAMGGFAKVGLFLQVLGVLLLLVSCANLANLSLAQAIKRRQEIAVRLALGAGRLRLLRQLLTESVLVAVQGGLAGMLVTVWLANLLSYWLQDAQWSDWFLGINYGVNFGFQTAGDLGPNTRSFGFALGVSILAGVVFGLVPALQASRVDLNSALKNETAVAIGGFRRLTMQKLLVIGQTATSLMLLVVASFFLKTIRGALVQDLGFEHKRLLAVPLQVEEQGYSETRARLFQQHASERIRALPGVESITLGLYRPFGPSRDMTFCDLGNQPNDPDFVIQPFGADYNVVGSDYFKTLGIPFVRGRDFDVTDQNGPLVVIINETVARNIWPDQDPIGKQMRVDRRQGPAWQKRFLAPGGGKWAEVIGVVKDARYGSLSGGPENYLYFSSFQRFEPSLHLFVRTLGHTKNLLPIIRTELQALDPKLPLSDLKTMTDHLGAKYALVKKFSDLTAVIGFFGLLLAAIGLYGVMAYAVSQQTKEFGIRIALGARRISVLALVMKEGALLAGIGIVAGLLAAFALARLITAYVRGIEVLDSLALAMISLLMILVMILACYLPARRATKVDPMEALRYE